MRFVVANRGSFSAVWCIDLLPKMMAYGYCDGTLRRPV